MRAELFLCSIYQTLYRELINIVFYVYLTITIHFYSDHGEVKASGKEGVGNLGETYLKDYLFIVHLIFL